MLLLLSVVAKQTVILENTQRLDHTLQWGVILNKDVPSPDVSFYCIYIRLFQGRSFVQIQCSFGIPTITLTSMQQKISMMVHKNNCVMGP